MRYEFCKKPHSKGGSFADGGRSLSWEVAVGLLWTVDHLVKVDAPMIETAASSTAASPRFAVAALDIGKEIVRI